MAASLNISVVLNACAASEKLGRSLSYDDDDGDCTDENVKK